MPTHPRTPYNFTMPSKRISVWTTNCLLTFSVLTAGVGFGRQMLKMQARESAPHLAITIPQIEDSCFQNVQFGNHVWSLCRSTVAGDKGMALNHLRMTCRNILRIAMADTSASSPQILPKKEKQFIDELLSRTPIDQEPGKWRLYEISESLPMIVGVTRMPLPATSSESRYEYRISIWGMAMPIQQLQWALNIFQSNLASGERNFRGNDVPTPPGARKILSLSEAKGGEIVSFRGSGRAAEWKQFYTDWYTRRGFSSTGWYTTGDSWYAKISGLNNDSIHIRFGPDNRGGLSGLLMIGSQETM